MHVLTAQQVQQCDENAIALGTKSISLMQQAARAVVSCVTRYISPKKRVLVCVGPGKNGGDGLFVACYLKDMGYHVNVMLHGATKTSLKGDAARAMSLWKGKIFSLSTVQVDEYDVVIDALFGIGLSRALDKHLVTFITYVTKQCIPVIAVDIPTGVCADSGRLQPIAFKATHTVSFTAKKIGQLLYPGKEYCGTVHVADIGVACTAYTQVKDTIYDNIPLLWQHALPIPSYDQHKYHRGHALIMGGDVMIGATKLAATASARTGAGLVTVMATPSAWPVYASAFTSIMAKPWGNITDLKNMLTDKRLTSILIGPGYGVGKHTRDIVRHILQAGKPTVLDADALNSFSGRLAALRTLTKKKIVVATPHEGEFKRMFEDIDVRDHKVDRALMAAKQSHMIIVLKGPDTVIASPDGRVVINSQAPYWLATAGSGDVLAGIIAGLLAQGMPAFEAANAAVWLHSQAGFAAKEAMLAEDLLTVLPDVIRQLRVPV